MPINPTLLYYDIARSTQQTAIVWNVYKQGYRTADSARCFTKLRKSFGNVFR